jgi:formamidopyrimidine-DNA glycosylase
MPELPEVEVVRRGVARWVTGCRFEAVEVHHPRAVRRHEAGPVDFVDRLRGQQVLDVVRRGKFCWLELDGGDALLAHLGMSGQLLMQPPQAQTEAHLRVRMTLSGGPADRDGRELRFVDQRMFGLLALTELHPPDDGLPPGAAGPDGAPGGTGVPTEVRHIARDLLDPHLDLTGVLARLRRRRSGIKRALLDQQLASGVGNIYADEALWRARLHGEQPADKLRPAAALGVLDQASTVMREALGQGGTSFDSLYVDVNGSSGYFSRSLAVYGREGKACPECGTPIVREAFTNRSSFRCPRCQPVRTSRARR